MIELTHLVKEFGDLTAVDDLSLTVGKGEFFAVLGPNAAGKTTTIKSKRKTQMTPSRPAKSIAQLEKELAEVPG